MEYQKKFTANQKFTIKARNFSDYLKASDDASKPKTISTKNEKGATGSDRNVKDIIMEGKFKVIGGVKVIHNETSNKIQYRIPKDSGIVLESFKAEYKDEIQNFIGKKNK